MSKRKLWLYRSLWIFFSIGIMVLQFLKEYFVLLGRAVLEGGGTIDFPNLSAAQGSPLAKLLFRYKLVKVGKDCLLIS